MNAHLAEILRHVSTILTIGHSDVACARELKAATEALRRAVASTGRRASDVGPPVPERRRRLTPRDREVVRLLLAGASYKDVAAGLGLSFMSAQSRVKAVYAKLGVHSKAELAEVFRKERDAR